MRDVILSLFFVLKEFLYKTKEQCVVKRHIGRFSYIMEFQIIRDLFKKTNALLR